MSRRTSLLDFPNELLHAVKDMIDPHDLLSNVCYFDLCDRTAACFDGENTSFWLRMCRANGLGKRNKDAESPSAFRSWKNVALQCARHAWVCDHPACGRARLEENQLLIRGAADQWSGWTVDRTMSNDDVSGNNDVIPSSLFEHIGFKTGARPWERTSQTFSGWGPTEDLPYLRPVNQGPKQEVPELSTLVNHPIVSRSFATFPPLEGMAFYMFVLGEKVLNTRGVTIDDVAAALVQVMDEHVRSFDLRYYMDTVDGNDPIVPQAWTFRDTLSALERVRDWFKILKWDGLTYDGKGTGGCYFQFHFVRRQLPDTPHAIIGMSSEDVLR